MLNAGVFVCAYHHIYVNVYDLRFMSIPYIYGYVHVYVDVYVYVFVDMYVYV